MAKKTTKPATKSSAKTSKPAPKTAAKPAAKAKAKAEVAKKASLPDKKAALKKTAEKSEGARPALMTARGKVKAETATAAEKPAVESKSKTSTNAGGAASKEFDNSGDQLIAMAKEEMSKINKSGDPEKSAEKSSKFKPIKIERGNATDEKAKWQELNKRYGKEKAVVYKMSESFESLKPIQHKVLGWGFILTNDNNRLEVLFENGIKMLISNYKAN